MHSPLGEARGGTAFERRLAKSLEEDELDDESSAIKACRRCHKRGESELGNLGKTVAGRLLVCSVCSEIRHRACWDVEESTSPWGVGFVCFLCDTEGYDVEDRDLFNLFIRGDSDDQLSAKNLWEASLAIERKAFADST